MMSIAGIATVTIVTGVVTDDATIGEMTGGMIAATTAGRIAGMARAVTMMEDRCRRGKPCINKKSRAEKSGFFYLRQIGLI
jgi:hypothetical protein